MDNRYYNYGCPPLMQDARFLTNYLPKRTYDQIIRSINNIDTSQNYKLFLQDNGNIILKTEFEKLIELNTCSQEPPCDFIQHLNARTIEVPNSILKDNQGKYSLVNNNVDVSTSCGCKSNIQLN
jgi:hypothetical protein